MQKDNIKLREVTKNDMELIMSWRSNELIYRYFIKQNGPLSWKEHYDFWISRKNRKDWIILLKEHEQWRKIGSINVSDLDKPHPEIGIFIGEIGLWGRHIGRNATKIIVDWLKKKNYAGAIAIVLKENHSSIRLFESLNFKKFKEINNHKGWELILNF